MKKFFAWALVLVMGLGLAACTASPSGEGKATYSFKFGETINAQTVTKVAIQAAFIAELSSIKDASAVGVDAVELTGDYATNDDLAVAACEAAEKVCKKFDYENNDSYKVVITVTYESGKSRTLYKCTLKEIK